MSSSSGSAIKSPLTFANFTNQSQEANNRAVENDCSKQETKNVGLKPFIKSNTASKVLFKSQETKNEDSNVLSFVLFRPAGDTNLFLLQA